MKIWSALPVGLLYNAILEANATPLRDGDTRNYVKNVPAGSMPTTNTSTPVVKSGASSSPKKAVAVTPSGRVTTVGAVEISVTTRATVEPTGVLTATSSFMLGGNKKKQLAFDPTWEDEDPAYASDGPINEYDFDGEYGDENKELTVASIEDEDDEFILTPVDDISKKSTSDSDEAEPTLAPSDALQPAKPGNITIINGKVALDITDIVESMFSDTKLFHRLAQSDVDAVDICKSYAFDPSQINWHIAGTYEWMLDYTLANQNREFFKKNGLISTIAFDFLGINNFKCAIGTSHLCTVDCPTVVKSVEDLEIARNVFFALTSATHMLTITEIVHNAMESAQSNMGSMVTKMVLDNFYSTPTKGEQERAKAWQFFIQVSIWAVQSAIGSLIPIVPWAHIQDYIIYQASRILGLQFDSTGRLDRFPAFEFDRWRTNAIADTVNEMIAVESGPNAPGSWLNGDSSTYNPAGSTFQDWWHVNGKTAGKWNRWVSGDGNHPARADDAAGNSAGWLGPWNSMFPDFRRNTKPKGSAHATGQAWSDLKNLCSGTAQRWRGKWWWVKNTVSNLAADGPLPPDAPLSYLDAQRKQPPISKLKPGEKIISWGPMESLDTKDRWRYSEGGSPSELLMDVWSRGVATRGDFRKFPLAPMGLRNMTKKLDGTRKAVHMLLPVGVNFAMPMYLRDVFESFAWHGSDLPHDHNAAHMTWMIQETGRFSRRMLKENVNRMFTSAEVGKDGATHISNALAMGSFLPANRGSLHQWTDSSIEDAMTKNMYFKTLNAAMRSQKHFISCTPHLLKKVSKHKIVDKQAVSVPTCLADNTGPENLRACIPISPTIRNETVCYLYRWADRGMAPSHHVEEPWGWEQLQNFDASVEDIIISSFLTHRHTFAGEGDAFESLFTAPTLSWGPTAEFITDPTTPGMFSIPVCNTPYNWNGPTHGYSYSDDTNLWSSRKSLPCYCGSLGNETQSVWAAMRLDISGKRREYMTMLCPRQIDNKIKNKLERYVAKCRLRIKKKGGINFMRQDHLCDVLIDELEARGIEEIGQVTKEQTKVLLCKVHQKSGGVCGKYRNTPISEAWREAEELRVRNEEEKGEESDEENEVNGGIEESVVTEDSDTDENSQSAGTPVSLEPEPKTATEPATPTTAKEPGVDYRAHIKPAPRGGKPSPRKLSPTPAKVP
ncbi:hypothetical protein BDD12DRAFT_909774 [Trichophaea hybrida]|nr:hypothetical protein BDD12DRAFT_909774 [Trichophaea hybrida]